MRRIADLARRAELVSEVGRRAVELARVEPGMTVLDAACGAGNAAIPAAQEGARTIGLDLSPDMLALARERAADYMVEIDWVEGDVQELPFADGSFERVLSVFGYEFAPDPRRAAAELRRVLSPGGVIAVAVWGIDPSLVRLLGEPSLERGTLELDGESRDYLLAVVR
jgi:ubiquinone/menaquinone biosynthesis C-methylase UbiE